MAWRELLRLRQRQVAVGIEQADGVVYVVEVDHKIVKYALVMLDLASRLPALFDQPGQRVRTLYHLDLPVEPEILMGSRCGA